MILADINTPKAYPQVVTVPKAGTIVTLASLLTAETFESGVRSIFIQNTGSIKAYWSLGSSAPANVAAMFPLDIGQSLTINVPALWANRIYVAVDAGATDGKLGVLQQS